MNLKKFWTYRRIVTSRRFAVALWRSRGNIISNGLGTPPDAGPYMAELDVTYRCNCRCIMCQRWRHARAGEMTLAEYLRLADHFHNMGVHLVSIAGGEPLLRDDIFAIIDAFSKRGMAVNLCTNGVLLERHAEALCKAGASCITVSLDAANAGCHEKIRGAPDSYLNIREGILAVLGRSPTERPLVRVRMTISNLNLLEVRTHFRTWKDIADDVLFQPVHHSQNSFYTGLEAGDLCIDPTALAQQLKNTPMARDGYLRRLVDSLKQTGAFPRHRCYAGVLMVRVDPWGNVFPCLEQHVRVGSLREKDFRAVWNSDAFNLERARISSDPRCSCWYNNTAMIGHYGKLLYHTTPKRMREITYELLKNSPKAQRQTSTSVEHALS